MPSFVEYMFTNMRKKGFSAQNRFLAIIEPNAYVSSKLGYTSSEIKRRLLTTCCSVSQPSKGFLTHEMSISQPTRLIPYAINTNNSSGMSLNFYVLGDMFESNIFRMWQDLIVDPKTKEQSYYDDYAKGSSIIIAQLPKSVYTFEQANLGMNLDLISGLKFTEIYPYNITLNNGSQDYANSAEPLQMKVDFMFREIKEITEKRAKREEVDTLKLVDSNGRFVAETVEGNLDDSRKEFQEYQRRLSEKDYEKYIQRQGFSLLNTLGGFFGF